MPTPPPEPTKEEEEVEVQKPDPVLAWRKLRLLKAGYDAEAASLLAADREVSLEQAESMLKNGCSASLALLILL